MATQPPKAHLAASIRTTDPFAHQAIKHGQL
jgi:hypothetical protein